MNHLPYEEWLLSDEPLDLEQQAQLDEHLSNCESCRQLASAWRSVASAIRVTPEVMPAAGFTQRWQARQTQRRAAQNGRITWIVLTLCTGGALATLFGLALPQVGGLLTPVEMLSSLLHSISVLFATVQDVGDVLSAIFTHFPLGVPILLWIVITMSVAVWSVIWFVFIWRLPKIKRSQNEVQN